MIKQSFTRGYDGPNYSINHTMYLGYGFAGYRLMFRTRAVTRLIAGRTARTLLRSVVFWSRFSRRSPACAKLSGSQFRSVQASSAGVGTCA